jgi:hypothetical protein
MRRLLIGAYVSFVLVLSAGAQAQTRYGASVYVQTTAPIATTGTTLGSLWWDTSGNALNVLTQLSPAVWTPIQTGTGGGGSVPTGFVGMVLSGTCPSGFAEVSALNGVLVRGTVAANGNVGTTGGSDSYTPQGSVAAPIFTGASATTSAVSAGTPAGSNSVPTYTGALGTLAVTAHTVVATKQGAAAGNVVTTATHAFTGVPGGTVSAPTFTGSALGTHTHTLTATGSNSAPSFTGTPATVIPAYVNAIFCQKT